MNAVDESIRRTFESDWRHGRAGDIASYLPAPDAPSFMATLEELVCIDLEFRWLQLSGVADQTTRAPHNEPTVGAQPRVEDYLATFPQLNQAPVLQRLIDQEIWVRKNSPYPPSAEEYQRRFPQLEVGASTIQRLLRDANGQTRAQAEEPTFTTGLTCPRAFGPYQLEALLGRGGMGLVYRARQSRADRFVAIKIANCAQFSPGMREPIRQRFETEVRAAARLSHDHLMPIYDVGEVNGSLYYTMPIVDGDLAGELREQPLSSARAAKYLAQAARGLDVAHRQGLLHRDLKPHNLMFDRELDRVLLADFGLARLGCDDQHLTLTGEIIGTPPYMAPEQIRDPRTIDGRADIYALGATLYHLLVGRPPFQAATATETLRQVLEEDPAAPRALNPQIDADLETICLRCLQKEPRLRFATAGDLADDLERYLRGEPILSRPLSQWGRLARWRRRNPALAALTAGLAGALVTIAVVAVVGWYSTHRQLARVVANSRQGQAALNELFTFVRTEPLLDQPGQEAVRQSLLARGLKHYESLIELAEENETLPADLLAARTELGLLSFELQGPTSAQEQFQQVIEAAERLPDEQQATPAIQIALADSWNGLGQAYHRLGLPKEAAAAFGKAISIRRAIVRRDKHDTEARRKLANAIMNLALAEAAAGNVEQSRAEQANAQRQRLELLAEHPKDPKLLRDLAQGEFNLARLDLTNSSIESGLKRLRDATTRFEQLTRDYPTDALLWQRYIECLLTMSMFEKESGQPRDDHHKQSPALVQQAIDYLQPLASLAPDNRTYRLRLIELYQQAIEQLLAANQPATAAGPWETMQTRLIEQLDQGDLQPDVQRVRLNSLRQRALISLGMGKKDDAKRQLQAALDAWHAAKEQPLGATFRKDPWKSDWSALEQLLNSL